MYAQMLGPGRVAELDPPSRDGVDVLYSDEYVAKRIREANSDRIEGEGMQRNLYSYCHGNPLSRVDPNGLRDFTFRIHYYFQTMTLAPGMEAEVKRILTQCFSRYGGTQHRIFVLLIPVKSRQQYDAIEFGWVYAHDDCPRGVNLGMRDSYKGADIGQGGGFKGNMNPGNVLSGVLDAAVDYSKAVGAVIVHEAVHHGIVTAGHGPEGHIDSQPPVTGSDLSERNCRRLMKKCELREGD